MSHGSKPGSGCGGAVAYPLLLECDSRGQVLWMSEQTRLALGHVENLADTMTAAIRCGAAELTNSSALRFSRLLETGHRVLVSAQPAAAGRQVRGELASLLHVQSSFLLHFFRLQEAERNLSVRVHQGHHGSGRKAVRQVELERQRLGRELHTGVGQILAAIRLQLEIVERQAPDLPGPVWEALGRVSLLAIEALDQVRAISKELHPPEWQRLTLAAALRQLWDLSGIPQAYAASLRMEPLPREPDLDVKTVVYRAAQEALSNIARHSRATRVEASLEACGGQVVLAIRDNGIGFDGAGLFAAPASVASGIGLRSIREQAAALGGKLEIESSPLGTKLELTAPFSSPES